jgi:hypothetical protein
MTDIFISYASEDRERTRAIADALRARGWSVWWDRDVKVGQAFDKIIEGELDTAKCIVVLWSNDSVASDWVKSEAAAAVQRGVLVPALIDDVRLPLEFSRRQTADLIGFEGDPRHPGFQVLCDGISGIAHMNSRPDATRNRQASRGLWNRGPILRGWWQTLPGILLASAVFLAALAALRVSFNHSRTSTVEATPVRELNPSIKPASRGAQPPRAASTGDAAVPSTDRDKPTRLTANELRGDGVGQHVSYYYVFNAGPGIIRVTVDGKNKKAAFADAVSIELSDLDAKRLLGIHLGYTPDDKRVVGKFQVLGRQQQVIMRVMLDEATIDYMVRLEGAVDFSAAVSPSS